MDLFGERNGDAMEQAGNCSGTEANDTHWFESLATGDSVYQPASDLHPYMASIHLDDERWHYGSGEPMHPTLQENLSASPYPGTGTIDPSLVTSRAAAEEQHPSALGTFPWSPTGSKQQHEVSPYSHFAIPNADSDFQPAMTASPSCAQSAWQSEFDPEEDVKTIHENETRTGRPSHADIMACASRMLEKEKEKEKMDPEAKGKNKADGPGYRSWASWLEECLNSAPDKSMALPDIYRWMELYCTREKDKEGKWRNGVRSNLSLNKAFVSLDAGRHGDPEKKCRWHLKNELGTFLPTSFWRKVMENLDAYKAGDSKPSRKATQQRKNNNGRPLSGRAKAGKAGGIASSQRMKRDASKRRAVRGQRDRRRNSHPESLTHYTPTPRDSSILPSSPMTTGSTALTSPDNFSEFEGFYQSQLPYYGLSPWQELDLNGSNDGSSPFNNMDDGFSSPPAPSQADTTSLPYDTGASELRPASYQSYHSAFHQNRIFSGDPATEESSRSPASTFAFDFLAPAADGESSKASEQVSNGDFKMPLTEQEMADFLLDNVAEGLDQPIFGGMEL